MQDLADDNAFDITEECRIGGNEVIIPGEILEKIGTSRNATNDTAEPGVVVRLERM